MSYIYDFANLHYFTFVSELVRRQKTHYRIPFLANRKSQLPDEFSVECEPYLRFRWINAFDESGTRYLRLQCINS